MQVTPKGILLRKESRQYPEATGAQAAEDLLSRLGAGSWPALQEGPGGGAPKGTPSKERMWWAWPQQHGSDKTALFLGGHGGCETSS